MTTLPNGHKPQGCPAYWPFGTLPAPQPPTQPKKRPQRPAKPLPDALPPALL